METLDYRRPPSSLLGGLLMRKEVWALSGIGKLVVALLATCLVVTVGKCIYPFLAVTDRIDSPILIVEGWLHPYGIDAAASEFKRNVYRRVFTTGGPIVGKGGYVNDFQTSASVGAERLKQAGVPPEFVQMVPSRVDSRDRTYGSALALREWFRQHDNNVRSFNIVTEGAHGRRTRLTFEEAFGPDFAIGVISVHSPDFDSKHWWRYSEGTEEVIQETIEYFYAKFLFRPSSSWSKESARSASK